MLLQTVKHQIRHLREEMRLTPEARAARVVDQRGLPADDPGSEAVMPVCMAWLAEAQDHSRTDDGGVARDFSLLTGWNSSYPETTGYIIPTCLAWADRTGDVAWAGRARRMLDWLCDIQLEDGGFQGGRVDAKNVRSVAFNTGQILIGLAAGVERFDDPRYRLATERAGDWMVNIQDPDGAYRRGASPFTSSGDKTYDTHAAWGVLDAEAAIGAGGRFTRSARSNIEWALRHQQPNGWFAHCCLTEPARPLTHTLAYVLRGILEGWRHTGEARWLEAAERTAKGLLRATAPDGHLPGRLNPDWTPAVSWSCLTGATQTSYCWMKLYQETGDEAYWDAARRVNAYVRRTISLDGPQGIRGGVKGSFPVSGGYGTWQFLNWACKFSVDAFMLESDLQKGTP